MTKYIKFDEEGQIISRLDSKFHSAQQIDGALKVSDDVFNKSMDVSKNKWVLRNGEVVAAPHEEPRKKTKEELRNFMVLSAYQVRKVLNVKGLREEVESKIKAADIDIQDAWNHATEFERSHEFIATMGGVLGLTDEQLDDLFIDGAKL